MTIDTQNQTPPWSLKWVSHTSVKLALFVMKNSVALPLSCAFANLFRSPLITKQQHALRAVYIMNSSPPTIPNSEKQVVVDPFCFRQFRESTASTDYSGTVFDISIEEFETIVNRQYNPSQLHDGYAPFCKHIFLSNDFAPNVRLNVLPITPENEHLLRTRYHARNEKELPVLERFFPKASVDDALPVATVLDVILYSREQIQLENAAQGTVEKDSTSVTAPWGVVSIKAQDRVGELPMNPITSMRNALGKEEGGSGVPLDRSQYMEAVDYWKNHAVVF